MAADKEQTGKNEKQYRTDGGKSKSNAIEVPSISLPKGGGAIKGIDQKFTVNAVNGTAAFSIPLPVSAARGVVPGLSLSYNSGGGNGIFGLGWSLSLPSIKRKTDKELPQYNDYIDSDTYLLSEAEDLVPEYKREADGKFTKDTNNDFVIRETQYPDHPGWTIRFYKPRIEGLFARIERWTGNTSGEIKWRVTTKDNITTLYGWSAASRIADPANPLKRIYEWLPEAVYDDKGNCAKYVYAAENDTGIYPVLPHNRNRLENNQITYTNLYPDRIFYGNMDPYNFDFNFFSNSSYLFETVFDYGQYNSVEPYDVNDAWAFRSDAFSEYKAGFEIRTTRLCKRVLLFHHFTELIDGSALVKSLDFNYGSNGSTGFTFLNTATAKGYIKYASGSYSSKSLPAMEFTYSAHVWNNTVKEISADNLLHAPVGLIAPYQFTDLYNEGLPGILSEQGNAWYYKRNLGHGNFEAAQLVSPKPSFTGLGNRLQLVDLDGDGSKQIVSFNSDPKGYFEINDDDEWQPFKSFKALPNIDLNDPNAKLLDLNGDGKTDVLLTEDTVLTWYASEGREGFSDYYRRPKAIDEDKGPKVIFADSIQSIFLADMSGDGLVDIVRIRNGEVCYWPNMGYGNFGAKVVMDNAPVFDSDNDFNPAYIKIADIDGSGTPDLIYLGKNKFSCWLNFNGNGYSTTPYVIDGFPAVHNAADITVTDLLGNGLACIVWSSPLQKDARSPLRYIDLMNSRKPHIMVKHINNLGMEVEMEYTPSTQFYIDDKLAGKPWVTKLHFPVYCLSKVKNSDKVTGHTFTSSYTYHHGYFDHAEKEFRGFGRVDQLDLDSAENWQSSGGTITDDEINQAPVLTRSWFHTGAYTRDKKILDQFAQEHWYKLYNKTFGGTIAHPETPLPPARIVPDGLNAYNDIYVTGINHTEQREAYRACKSMPLRTEVFAQDAPLPLVPGSDEHKQQLRPYTVGTHNCMIELLQPKGKNRHAVYCVKESEAITYSYERFYDETNQVTDPRVTHTLNLAMDIYGNVLQSASVVYARLNPDGNLPTLTYVAQDKTAVVFTDNTFTNDVINPVSYRLRLPCETKTYEITGLVKTQYVYGPTDFAYTLADFNDLLNVAAPIPYEQLLPGTGPEKRLIEHVQSLYYNDALDTTLPLGTTESLGLLYENYQLAYTNNGVSDLVADIFQGRVGVAELRDDGRYIQRNDDWWVRSGVIQYFDAGFEDYSSAILRFYTPVSFTDPYGSVTTVVYDTRCLFIEETYDQLGNTATVMNFDYRTLSPVTIRDFNNNLTIMLLDELGLPKAMAVNGYGDNLFDLTAHTLAGEISDTVSYFNASQAVPSVYSSMEKYAAALLQKATVRYVYDFDCYKNSGGTIPAVVSTIMREQYWKQDPSSPMQLSFEYSGGFNKVVMKKVQAEAGMAKQVTVSGSIISVNTVDTTPNLRWIGNGRTILNNKGNPIKQYEPYFSVTAGFENAKQLVEQGVSPVMHYDAPGRVVRTDFPDGTFTKAVYEGWKQIAYDQNDTCLDSDWYVRMSSSTDAQEAATAAKAALHDNTPKTIHFDSMGRPVLSVEMPEPGIFYDTYLVLDIENNLRRVIDARGNTVMQYKYDMLGNMVYQYGMDNGQRWLLHNCTGKPLYTWDERDHVIKFDYDELQRPLTVKVTGGEDSLDNIVEKYIYGESVSNAEQYNLRGNLYQHYDTGGLEEMPEYDCKNVARQTSRWLAEDYKNVVNWQRPGSTLESNAYTISTSYDALGRIKLQTAPDGSIITPAYNRRGVLAGETVTQAGRDTLPLKDIKYDAKGQRTSVEYGNNVRTTYTYDENTFRLLRLLTENTDTSTVLQDLNYTYDAAGNITFKKDDAICDVFYNNTLISGLCEYTYDALYRLTEAMGRESEAAATFGIYDNYDDAAYKFQINPGPNALQTYTQYYTYDEVGNMITLQHDAPVGGYTRTYKYEGGANNRLTSTRISSGQDYKYDIHDKHGYIYNMPHLSLTWNFKEEIASSSAQFVTVGTPEITWYQYDSKGKRLRKITENYSSIGSGTQKDQRIYIEGYEYYEEFGSGKITETLSLIDEGQRFVMYENSNAYGRLIRYQHPNHQSSTNLETDERGNVITYEEYHPFGTTAYQATEGSVTAFAKRYRYTGMERDDETGLSYHNARYYIPWLGRWMNCDPIGIGDGVNVYAYCGNNPVGNTDKGGMQMNGNDPKNKTWVSAGVKLSMTFGGGTSLSLFAGGSSRSGPVMSGGNLSATIFAGGPGTSSTSPFLFNFAISASVTAGGGTSIDTKLNILSSGVGTGMVNNFKGSVTYGASAIFSSGGKSESGNRNQIVGYFGFRALGLTAGHANDVRKMPLFPFGDAKDQFHSAILHANLTFKNGISVGYTNDMYYGKSNDMALYSDDIKDASGQNYDNQSPFNMALNNAQESVNFSIPASMTKTGFPITVGIGRIGEKSMWPSNKMHDTMLYLDKADGKKHSFHHLKVLDETKPVIKVQYN